MENEHTIIFNMTKLQQNGGYRACIVCDVRRYLVWISSLISLEQRGVCSPVGVSQRRVAPVLVAHLLANRLHVGDQSVVDFIRLPVGETVSVRLQLEGSLVRTDVHIDARRSCIF